MAKWGTFNWGDGTHWGSTAELTNTVTWIVQVDWDGDGTLDGENEAQWLMDAPIRLGREEYLDASGKGFEHMRVGMATLVFDNHDGRYDPRNASSPLYPNILPGKMIQIRVRDNSDESVYTQFTGIIDQIEPRGYRQETTITCVDYMQFLADQELTFDAELFNTTITAALNHLLTQANYPGGRLLQEDAQPVWVFAVNGQSAAQAAHQIADAGLGMFWVDQYGRARYQERNHPTSGNNLNQTVFLNDPKVNQPWDGVYNDVTVTATRYIKLPAAIIFTLPEAVYIANGNSETITVNYDPATDVQLKSLEANTRSDGEGTDLTFTASEIDLGLTGGTLVVSNASGSNGYLLEVRIRGRAYSDMEQKFNATDATSQATYGLRKFYLDSPFLQDRNYATAFATILKNFLKDDRASLVLQMQGRATWQYYLQLMGFINFSSTTLGISSTSYQILGLEHDWRGDNGQDVVTTFHLHRTLVDTTAITSSSLETAPKVPPAPSGYEDPGGDADTIASDPALSAQVNAFIVRLTPRYAGVIDASSDMDSSEFVQFTSALASEDVDTDTLITDYSKINMEPGVYMVMWTAAAESGTQAASGINVTLNIKVYDSGGSLLDTITQNAYDDVLGDATNTRGQKLRSTMCVLVSDPSMSYIRFSLSGSTAPYFTSSTNFVQLLVSNFYFYRISTTPVNLV